MEGKQPKSWKVRNLSLSPAVRQSVRPTVCFATAASRKKGSYFSSLLRYKSETPSETSENLRKLSSVYYPSFAIAALIVPSFISSLARTIFPRPSMLAMVGQREEQRGEHSRVSWWRGELGFSCPVHIGWLFPRHVLHCPLVSSVLSCTQKSYHLFPLALGPLSFFCVFPTVVPSFTFTTAAPLLSFAFLERNGRDNPGRSESCTFFYFYPPPPHFFLLQF
jgi:hypothetical protein